MRVLAAFVGISGWLSAVAAEVPATEKNLWNVARPVSNTERRPLARLVRNPDTSDGSPAFALTDQSGTIQRYVEPVPGIDLESYVGYAVIVRHDTGRTLLASQLELPGMEPASVPKAEAAIGDTTPNRMASLLGRAMAPTVEQASAVAGRGQVLPAQYMQGQYPQNQFAQNQYAQGGMPMMQGAMQPVMIQQGGMQPGMPTMMTPQGVVPIESGDPNMMGGEWGGYPAGAGPIYLDGPQQSCGPEGCSTCTPYSAQQPMMIPGQGQYYSPNNCQQCQPVPCPQPPPPPPALRWSLWGDALWLHPTGVDMAHAQQQNGIGGAGTVPYGLIGVADPDYDLGFRLGGQLRFAATDAVFAEFTFYESDADSSLVAPTIVGGGGAVGSLVQHPGPAVTSSAGPVDVTYGIDFQVGDIAYRHYVVCDPTTEVSVYLGARYGNLDQQFGQTGVFAGGAGGTIDTTSGIDFDGFGPLAGVSGERVIGNSRYSFYGRAQSAALTGEFSSHYREFNSTTVTLLAESFWNDDRIVPMFDYELGVAWVGPKGRFRVAAGYMMSFWFNAVTTPVFVDAVQADNYVDLSDTIAFDGLVGHVECRW
jgi:hypothetical protein